MGFLERIGEAKNFIGFYIRHGTTLTLADRARNVMLSNNQILEQMIANGEVTSDRLHQIFQDTELQEKYSNLMRQTRDGGSSANGALLEILNLQPEELAGWFEYYRKFYERRWGLELVSPTED